MCGARGAQRGAVVAASQPSCARADVPGSGVPRCAQRLCFRVFLAPGPRAQRAPLPPPLALKARDVFNGPLVTPSSRVSLLHNWHPLARNRECRWVHRNAGVATAHRSKESTEPKPRRVRARVRMRACVRDLVCACVLASSVQGHTHK